MSKSTNDLSNHLCFKCGSGSHSMRTCVAPSNTKCTKCGLFAHCDKMHDKVMEWRKSRNYGEKECGSCGKKGYVKIECPEQGKKHISFGESTEKICYKCNQKGHVMAECVGDINVRIYAEKTCY